MLAGPPGTPTRRNSANSTCGEDSHAGLPFVFLCPMLRHLLNLLVPACILLRNETWTDLRRSSAGIGLLFLDSLLFYSAFAIIVYPVFPDTQF
jgi:hypothetical protein